MARDRTRAVFTVETVYRRIYFPCGGFAIARGRIFRPEDKLSKRLRTNEQIRISPIRLIDEDEQQVGIIEVEEARRRAREAGLDLVEVAPQSKPPVCRIMDYGKWKYQQKKKDQKARSHSKQSELKEVHLSPKIHVHDLQIKTDHAREFLTEGHKVQFTMLFRGRQMAHQDIGMKILLQVRDDLAEHSKVEAAPRSMGRRMTMVLAPARHTAAKPKPAAAPPEAKPQPAAAGAVNV